MNDSTEKSKPATDQSNLKNTDSPASPNADSIVYKGKQAIDAGKITDPKSEEDEKKDAEQWRNEG